MDSKTNLPSFNFMVISNVALAFLIAIAFWFLFSKLSDQNVSASTTRISGSLNTIDEQAIDKLAEQKLREQTQTITEMLNEQMKAIEENKTRLEANIAKQDSEIALLNQQNEALTKQLGAIVKNTQSMITKQLASSLEKFTPNNSVPDKAPEAVSSEANKPDQAPAPVPSEPTETVAKIATKNPSDETPTTQPIPPAEPAPANPSENNLGEAPNTPTETLAQTDNTAASSTPIVVDQATETRWVTVEAGDTLGIIAERVYQNIEMYTKILSANPEIQADPNLIVPGLRLKVPE